MDFESPSGISGEQAFTLLLTQIQDLQSWFDIMQGQYQSVQDQLSRQDTKVTEAPLSGLGLREEAQSSGPSTSIRLEPLVSYALPQGFKPTKPDMFSGRRNESLDSWLFQVEQYMELCKLPVQVYVQYATTLLRENAMVW